MASPIDFPERNDILRKPADWDNCSDLYIHRGCDMDMPIVDKEGKQVLKNGQPYFYPLIISCWQLTEQEIHEIIRTGKVYAIFWGDSHPAFSMVGNSPFPPLKEEG